MFLGYATGAGRTFLDRELYLPQAWTDDRERCREAGVGEDVEFATKPELAMRMITRALEAGVPAGWVTGDEVYGQHAKLRMMLEERQMPYVLAVAVNQRVIATVDGRIAQLRGDELAAMLPGQAWKKLSAGDGAKGPRVYHWARAAIRPLEDSASYWLLVRRSLTDPTDRAYYLRYGPEHTPLRELVRVAGARWAIEESFQTARARSGSTSTRSAATTAGTNTSPWPCSPTPSSPSPPPTPAKQPTKKGAAQQRRRPHPTDPARGPRPTRPPHLEPATQRHVGAALVTLATSPPSPRPTLSLHSPRSPAINAAVVLGRRSRFFSGCRSLVGGRGVMAEPNAGQRATGNWKDSSRRTVTLPRHIPELLYGAVVSGSVLAVSSLQGSYTDHVAIATGVVAIAYWLAQVVYGLKAVGGRFHDVEHSLHARLGKRFGAIPRCWWAVCRRS